MSSSAPVAASSGQGDGDTTLVLATMVPYSSDGPTLALVGGASEHSVANIVNDASSGEQDARKRDKEEKVPLKKKQKLNGKSLHDATAPSQPPQKPTIDLAPLYNPRTLLPLEIVQTIEARCGTAQCWDMTCVPLVFTRNQNVRSGINRLKAYLGHERNADMSRDVLEKLEKEGTLIAVSAQGEATTKLVGIVEMARRVVGGGKVHGDAAKVRTKMWYLYTSLASRVVERAIESAEEKDAVGEEGDGSKNKSDEYFESANARRESMQDAGKTRKVPVLTVWMSKRSIPEFKKAFGEQIFEVHHPQDAT